MRDDWFEWDDEKAASNAAKHGISFEFAREAFEDPTWYDVEEPDPDEERYNRICMFQGRLITVTYVERAPRIRIISARLADKHEQRKYFQG